MGAWIGCSLLGSAPAERFGRKMTVLGTNLFFIIGGLVAASGSIYGLFIGRLISGHPIRNCEQILVHEIIQNFLA